ncbi:MAG: hypothetical protein MI921_17430 [Cytophagales bacterium]|nr:hypothetical protein [Cytophagales bacterium]
MTEYNQKENYLKITIPLSGIDELQDYKNGILRVLKEIEIDNISGELKDSLKSVYKLLSHLSLIEKSISDCNYLNSKNPK